MYRLPQKTDTMTSSKIYKRRGIQMNNDNRNKDIHPVPDLTDNYDYLKASSVTDCTGAVPRPPQNSAELDSYLDVYNFLPQCAYTNPSPLEIDMFSEDPGKNKHSQG